MKFLFLMTSVVGKLLSGETTNVTDAVKIVMNESTWDEKTTPNTWNFAGDSVCSDTQYFSFRSVDPEIDNNVYTLALTTPESCDNFLIGTSASGSEFVEKISEGTQQVQTGRCSGVNVSEVQTYNHTVLEEIGIYRPISGPDGGPSGTLACYGVKVTSLNPYKETPFSQCFMAIYNPEISNFKTSVNKCESRTGGAILGCVFAGGILCVILWKFYKNREAIQLYLRNSIQSLASQSTTLWTSGTRYRQLPQDRIQIELEPVSGSGNQRSRLSGAVSPRRSGSSSNSL